jgi:hypothetical protein
MEVSATFYLEGTQSRLELTQLKAGINEWVSKGAKSAKKRIYETEGTLCWELGHIDQVTGKKIYLEGKQKKTFQHHLRIPGVQLCFKARFAVQFQPNFPIAEILNTFEITDALECCAYGLWFDERIPEQRIWFMNHKTEASRVLYRLENGEVKVYHKKDKEYGLESIITDELLPAIQRHYTMQGESAKIPTDSIKQKATSSIDSIKKKICDLAHHYKDRVKQTWADFGITTPK